MKRNVSFRLDEDIVADLDEMALAFVDSGDNVLMPDPGYPPYWSGTRMRGGVPVMWGLNEENGFFYDFGAIDDEIGLDEITMMWINSPQNPTTRILGKDELKEAVDIAKDHDILLVSDEAYSEMYFDTEPTSVLEVEGARNVSLVLNSLSKRSNMTNYRIGFAAGRPELLDPFKEVQTNMHSGQAQVCQAAAIGALREEEHVERMREMYGERRDAILPALEHAGFGRVHAEGTFYIWVETPEGQDSTETAATLLKEHGIATTPGAALSNEPEEEDKNGKNFVRFALIQNVDRTREAAERIKEFGR